MRPVRGRPFTVCGWPLVVLGLALVLPGAAHAQGDVEALYAACSEDASDTVAGRCADAALTMEALMGGVGLLMSAGSALPASPSTAGRRLATQPRVVVDAGLAWSTVRHPDLSSPLNVGGPPDRRSFLYGAKLSVVVGVFEGFSPVSGVGGFLSLDGIGGAQLLQVDGLDGATESVGSWGGGVRLGLFRESFSLPGVTLSATYHRAGEIEYGNTGANGGTVGMRLRARSLRAVVGKDLLAVGISAGAGWDEYTASARITARGSLELPSAPPELEERAAGPVDSVVRKRYVFGGANLTWLVAQLAGEVAWVWESSSAPSIEGSGPYRPGEMELLGAVTVRITY